MDRKLCSTHFNAPLTPGSKLDHMWRCDRPEGHAGPHAQSLPSASLNIQSRFSANAEVVR